MFGKVSTRAQLGVVALAATAFAGTVVASPSADALGKIRCDANRTPTVAIGAYDPIMDHNQASSAHEHQFFGNMAWLSDLANPNAAQYNDLVGKSTNCRVAADTSAYWTPTLRYLPGTPKAGQLVPAQQFTAYYRPYTGEGSKMGPGIAYPADTRLVSSPGHDSWNCGDQSGAKSTPLAYIPDCSGLSGKAGFTLTAHVDFPSCWDGVLPNHSSTDVGDTSDNAHYAYPVRKVCPAGFPIRTVELRETIQYPYVDHGTDVGLSSDAAAGVANGRSLHGDFFNAWNQSAFESFVAACVNGSGTYTEKQCAP
jgi:hypothetical protein